MAANECPGRQLNRNLDSMVIRCPKCGALVEMFSDEAKTRCRCGETILREAAPSCIQWCPAAERCLGEVIDLREVRKRLEKLQKDAGGYVAEIGEKVRKARGRAAGPAGKPPRGRNKS